MKVIELTKGAVAVVDDEDFDRIAQYRWDLNGKGYAQRGFGKGSVKMHRVIMGATDPKIHVDHINGNKLDNRRGNLRYATHGQNKANSKVSKNSATGVKGVYRRSGRKGDAFRSHITADGKFRNLGTFKTIEAAHEAYKKAATEAFGEFARFN